MRQHCATQMVVLYLETSGVGDECLPTGGIRADRGLSLSLWSVFSQMIVWSWNYVAKKKKKPKNRHTLNVGHAAMICGGHHIMSGS